MIKELCKDLCWGDISSALRCGSRKHHICCQAMCNEVLLCCFSKSSHRILSSALGLICWCSHLYVNSGNKDGENPWKKHNPAFKFDWSTAKNTSCAGIWSMTQGAFLQLDLAIWFALAHRALCHKHKTAMRPFRMWGWIYSESITGHFIHLYP